MNGPILSFGGALAVLAVDDDGHFTGDTKNTKFSLSQIMYDVWKSLAEDYLITVLHADTTRAAVAIYVSGESCEEGRTVTCVTRYQNISLSLYKNAPRDWRHREGCKIINGRNACLGQLHLLVRFLIHIFLMEEEDLAFILPKS